MLILLNLFLLKSIDTHKGWYCVADEAFINPRDLVVDPKDGEKVI